MKNIGVVVQDARVLGTRVLGAKANEVARGARAPGAKVLGTRANANEVARASDARAPGANEVARAKERDYDSGLGESGIVATGIGFGDSLRIAVS